MKCHTQIEFADTAYFDALAGWFVDLHLTGGDIINAEVIGEMPEGLNIAPTGGDDSGDVVTIPWGVLRKVVVT